MLLLQESDDSCLNLLIAKPQGGGLQGPVLSLEEPDLRAPPRSSSRELQAVECERYERRALIITFLEYKADHFGKENGSAHAALIGMNCTKTREVARIHEKFRQSLQMVCETIV